MHAYSGGNGAGIGGGRGCGGEVSISGNATVFAQGDNAGSGIGSGDYNCNEVAPERRDTTVTISDNATVTAVGAFHSAGIGNGNDHRNVGKTDIIITGGTVNAISGSYFASAIGGGKDYEDGNPAQNVTVTINGTTGNTTVNASCTEDMESAISKGNGTADIIVYDADGVSPFGEDHSVVVRMYKKGSITLSDYDQNTHRYNSIDYNPGELYQTVHNRKYMDENLGTSNLKDDDLHDWQLVGEVVEPTLEKDGYADYVCSINKCGQTKRVVLPKLTPEESGSVEMREVGVIFWDAAAQTAPAALQGKVLSADEQTTMAAKAQVESLLADKANWKLAEDVGDLMIHPAADAAGTVYEQAVKASGCQYYVIANVTAQ